jgi:cyclin-dependent kinase 10
MTEVPEKIEKKSRLGEGAYGIVYQGEIKRNNRVIKVAVKRNFGEPDITGISSLREMSYLSFFNHPCITKLKGVTKGDPFEKDKNGRGAMTPLPGNRRDNLTEDSHHFVLEFADGDLEDFYPKCNDYYSLKVIMCQVLLGLEFVHSKGVIHRDLKPGNILVSIGKDGLPYAKIIDFGLACHPTHYRPSTPGTVTHWYRAPEICCRYDYYDYSSDMWSLGCVFYEIIIKDPIINILKDDNKEVFRKIINYASEDITSVYLNEYTSGGAGRFKHNYKKKNKKSIENILKETIDIRKFNDCGGGTLDEMVYIIENLLILDPRKRLTATECLDHEFFSIFEGFNKDMRKRYPPLRFDGEPKKVKIINCIERSWACNILYKIYNNRNTIEWYNNQIIFHALRVFDEYLVYKYNEGNLRDKVEAGIGRLHTKYDTEIYINTCVYMMFKYYNVLYAIRTWEEIFPDHLAKSKNLNKIEEFEKLYIEKISNYQIYSDSLIEYLDRDYNEKSEIDEDIDIRKYFINYTNIEMDYEGTMEDLYLQIREGLKK